MKITVAKLMKEYRKSGKIGRVTPYDEDHAREIATAIVARSQRETKGKQSG
jgi:hypothetical protein